MKRLPHKIKAHAKQHRSLWLTVWVVLSLTALIYVLMSYFIVPSTWRLFPQDRSALTAPAPLHADTKEGLLADPINLKIIGSEEAIRSALLRAGWTEADPINFRSAIRIAFYSLVNHPYAHAPISELYVFGKSQDLSFQLASAEGPSKRHHVRFWSDPKEMINGQPLWYGAASYDQGVGVSHRTGQFTHHISPDIDVERDTVVKVLLHSEGATLHKLSNFLPLPTGRNGGGDPYITDRMLPEITLGLPAKPL